jgi:hypothetical protein
MIFCRPRRSHAVAWSFGRSDVKLVYDIGELDYGDARARKDGSGQIFYTEEEFKALVESKNRTFGITYIDDHKRGSELYPWFLAHPELQQIRERRFAAWRIPPAASR